MPLNTNIPDPDDMNEQRALCAEVALREFAYEVSGPQGMADTPNRQCGHELLVRSRTPC
jgi:hypothetical protein